MPFLPLRSPALPFDRHGARLWARSSQGRRWLALEERELRRVLPEVFGRHCLQIGSWGRGARLLQGAETLHQAVVGSVSGLGDPLLARPEQLPLRSGSVDAILLPHTLEFSAHPHAVLREVDRVLSDRGRLFVLGYSPWGSWALRSRLGLRYRAFPSSARFRRAGQVADWLELLDYEVAEIRRFSLGFPWLRPHSETPRPGWNPSWSWLADAWLLVARKRVTPVNWIGRAQRLPLPRLGGVAPAAGAGRDAALGPP
ncbi:MAG TPA: methyltransferase domain-containing protein [Nevskiaceae bacterium]|nr:methyltransferase domain-containing protein [Nevskiaceae bacterium]